MRCANLSHVRENWIARRPVVSLGAIDAITSHATQREMTTATTSVFTEPDDYVAALHAHGERELVVTEYRGFRARLTQILLSHMSLSAGDESCARIAWVRAPTRRVRLSLPTRGGALIRGGAPAGVDEIITHCGGERFHERSAGPSRWRTIGILETELAAHGRAMVGPTFQVPVGIGRWRPAASALKRLTSMHNAAIRLVAARPDVVAAVEAARGLEQDLIGALVACLEVRPEDLTLSANPRPAQIMARFEDYLQGSQSAAAAPNIPEICAALAVSERALETICKAHLGMGPRRYINLRRMQNARRALRGGDPDAARVRVVAGRFGFRHPGRFATVYRAQFGEAPSETLRRSIGP